MQVDEFDETIPEQFDSLQDCVNYYTDVLVSIKEGHEKELYTKKEYKSKKKFVMKQYDVSLKFIKSKDKHIRDEEKKKLNSCKDTISSEISKPNAEQIPAPKTKKITQRPIQYQIEDKNGEKIEGQMDVEELNEGDVYEKD